MQPLVLSLRILAVVLLLVSLACIVFAGVITAPPQVVLGFAVAGVLSFVASFLF